MDKESALKKFNYLHIERMWVDDIIKILYKKGHIIVSPEEMEKINGMTILADVHGQNPFAEQRE